MGLLRGTRRALFGRRRREIATYSVTTVAAATHTIQSFGVVAGQTCRVYWGDGTFNDYTGTATHSHNYAGAGTWDVTIENPGAVRTFDIRDNKVNLSSAGVASMVNVDTFIATALRSGTFNSADVSAWRPTTFLLYSMPAGYAGTFDSVDVSAWRPGTFYLYSMPGYAGTFNSADVSAWRPTDFRLYSMPAGYAGTFNSADVSAWRPTTFWLHSMPAGYVVNPNGGWTGWTTTTNFQIQDNGLLTAAVNAALWELYQASRTPRTATGGTINVAGTNQAPSGVFQAAGACPVDAATDGKEVAHELLNDTCAVGFNKWATVTITA
jgi:hypothetical protein